MQLNLPILHLLENSQSILLAGAGGGFDVYGALPLYFALKEMGKNVHLGSYSFANLTVLQQSSQPEILHDRLLVGTKGMVNPPSGYLPESYITEWFEKTLGEHVPVWTFQSVGVAALKRLYATLIEKLTIDAIVLVDGGVDSLMFGDEEDSGSLLEDTISLTAIRDLDVPVKLLACLGFGTEWEVNHHLALKNMATLIKDGAFYGSCALTPQMDVFQKYQAVCEYVFAQPNHKKSHIQQHIISAVLGEFANYRRYEDDRLPLFVCPLMTLYWFFDAVAVNKRSLIAPLIEDDEILYDSLQTLISYRRKTQLIKGGKLPF